MHRKQSYEGEEHEDVLAVMNKSLRSKKEITSQSLQKTRALGLYPRVLMQETTNGITQCGQTCAISKIVLAVMLYLKVKGRAKN